MFAHYRIDPCPEISLEIRSFRPAMGRIASAGKIRIA
jgi:hypothetical protein